MNFLTQWLLSKPKDNLGPWLHLHPGVLHILHTRLPDTGEIGEAFLIQDDDRRDTRVFNPATRQVIRYNPPRHLRAILAKEIVNDVHNRHSPQR